jgi:hypothetical protein
LTPEAGEKLAQEQAERLRDADAIFITNDNVAAGVSKTLPPCPGKLLLTQATNGIRPEIAPCFERIEFSTSQTTGLAVAMLGKLLRGDLDDIKASRAWSKPTLAVKPV